MNKVTEANITIFKFFNKNFGQPVFHDLLAAVNAVSNPHYFYYHFLFIATIAAIMIYRHKNNLESLKHLLILGTSSILTLAI